MTTTSSSYPSQQGGSIQDGPLQTTLRDLALSVEWHDLRTLRLPNTEWSIIIGHKRKSDPLRAVLPLPLHTTSLKPASLKAIFGSLSNLGYGDLPEALPPFAPTIEEERRRLGIKLDDKAEEGPLDEGDEAGQMEEAKETNNEIDKEMIYMAIVTSDSTVVYYRLSRGIKKPADIPDE